MSRIENRCIAYIFDEMDPAERLEFERELDSDENLLIELESLKKTACSLSNMKCVEPPETVVNLVMSKAESTAGNSKESSSYRYLFASAAVTVIAVIIYGAGLVQDQESGPSVSTTEQSASVSSLANRGNSADVSDNTDELSPWVDNDEVIHFHERFNRGSVASVDSMFNSSLNKLTRVNSAGTLQQVQQQIHLTGGNR